MTQYDGLFFDYVDSGALRSAEVFTDLLYPELNPRSVLDAGCGRGGWARKWRDAGASQVLGIDGDYVDRSKLYVDENEFQVVDLNLPFNLQRRFDLVQSLEVAEHLKPTSSEDFVASLVAHGDTVMFSAAVPGQGGTQHINERPIEFWRSLFARHGYEAFDFIRPRLHSSDQVEPWYKYNSVVYAKVDVSKNFSSAMAESHVPSGVALQEYAPTSWLLRRAALRYLPVTAVDKLAQINAYFSARK